TPGFLKSERNTFTVYPSSRHKPPPSVPYHIYPSESWKIQSNSLVGNCSELGRFLIIISNALTGTAFIRTVNNKIMIGNNILPMFFIFFTQVLLLKTNEYKARKKFKNLQLVGLIK